MVPPFVRRYRELLPYLVLVAAWALFFWRFAAPAPGDRVTFPDGDFTQQFGVFRDIAYRSIVAGRFPLWADCLLSGYPFHADPQAQLFYPPVWLIFGALRLQGWQHFPIEALVTEAVLHYLAVSIFLYLFLRSLPLRQSAALLGALTFNYGGYLTGYPVLQTAILESATWLPLALLFAGRLAATHRTRDLALAALTLALALLAGHPQTFAYVALLTLAYFAFCADQARWGFGRFAAGAVAMIGLASALAAVQLIPSVHFIANSTRTSVAFDQAGHGFPFPDVLQFFLTGFVSRWHPLYAGILPLGLAAFALGRPGPRVVFWAGTALVALLLAFGTQAVAYDAAYWTVPGIRLFRDQERWALVVSLALAVLAALGADQALGPLSRIRRRALGRLLRAGGWLFAAALVLLAGATFLSRIGIDPSDWRRFPDRAGVMALGVGLALVALTVRARVPALRHWAPAIFLGVVILDLFAANRPVNRVPVFDAYPYNALLDAVRAEAGFFRVQDDSRLPGHAGCAYGYRSIDGITPYRVATYNQFLRRVPETVRWQLLGVKYVASWRSELWDDGGRRVSAEVLAQGTDPDERGNVTKLLGLDDAPRRAFLAHRAIVAENDDDLGRRLSDPGFDPFSTVVLSQSVSVDPPTSEDTLSVSLDVSGRLRLTTGSDSPSVLVVSEAYFPGWRATVDGRSAPVFRANGALIGVELSEGRHQIELGYRPATLSWGVAVSTATLLVTLGLVFTVRHFNPWPLWRSDA